MDTASCTAFRAYVEREALALPPTARQVLLDLVHDPGGDPLTPPMWHFIGDDLPRAAIFFQAPFLGRSFRTELEEHGRPACGWCSAPDGEWGGHLLRCPKAPPAITRLRDATLRAILTDVYYGRPVAEDFDSEANLTRLLHLQWRGATPEECGRKKYRIDKGRQPSRQALHMGLWYMREAINAYSPFTPLISRGRKASPRVPPLPVYGTSPFRGRAT